MSTDKLLKTFLICVLFIQQTFAQVFPSGFSQVKYIGIENGSAMALAPDGRVFICQKSGAVRIVKNDSLLTTPFLTLTVDQNGERGVSAITFDPEFNINHYVYIYYTAITPTIHNRLSRFTANGDVAVPGSELALLDAEPASAVFHNGGGLAFGPDGKLYLSMGEDNKPNNSQNLSVYKGKLLRINKDGSAPADNPYSSSTSEVTKKIWCLGLRNPYTLAFQPGTGKLFINNVGSDNWEEIHDGTLPNRNFGWPTIEGKSADPAFDNPVFAYPHESTVQKGCAIVGGTFFNPDSTNYPAEYIGKYFYMDYCNGWMYYLTLDGTVTNNFFSSGMGTKNLALQVWPDGNLYYIKRDEAKSGIYKIIYSSNKTPMITVQPTDKTVTAGQQVSFSVNASGTNPLNYQWRKNGVNITGATNSTFTINNVQSTHAGQYSVRVSNNFGNTTSNNATLTVTAFNASPKATIITPKEDTHYNAGDVISFSGNATDAEDGTLPASAFTWEVEFHHNNNHFHPGPSILPGIKNGSFTIPNIGETSAIVFYRLKLKVTDSNGLIDTTHVDILPNTSIITLTSLPSGLQLLLDDQPHKTPYSVLAVSGMIQNLKAVSLQTLKDSSYVFDHWTSGKSKSDFTVNDTNTKYTAVFTGYEAKIMPLSSTTFCSGNVTLQANTAQNLSYQWEKDSVSIPGAISSNYIASTSGDYRVKFTYDNFNIWSKAISVKVNKTLTAKITATGPTTFCKGKNVKLFANTCNGYIYQWIKNNVEISGATDSVYTATSPGVYQVKIAQGAAMAWSAETMIKVDSCHNSTVSVTENQSPVKNSNFKLNVFPNPLTGLFTIDICMEDIAEENMNIKVLNYIGQTVYEKHTQRINGCIRETIELDGSLSTGIYILQLTIGQKTENTKLLLTKK